MGVTGARHQGISQISPIESRLLRLSASQKNPLGKRLGSGKREPGVMSQKNEHLETLTAARTMAVVARRKVAQSLAGPDRGAHTENMRDTFIKLQNIIESLDRAIADEEQIAKGGSSVVINIRDRE